MNIQFGQRIAQPKTPVAFKGCSCGCEERLDKLENNVRNIITKFNKHDHDYTRWGYTTDPPEKKIDFQG